MKRIVTIALGILTLIGCSPTTNNSNSSTTNIDTTVQQSRGGRYKGRHIEVFRNNTISFFGKNLVMNDSARVMQQIKDVAEEDERLTVTDEILTVCNEGFAINIHDNGVILISSTQVDDPKIKPVVKYLKKLYGTASEEESDEYRWHKGGSTIRLRRLHSEEGGTVLLFD